MWLLLQIPLMFIAGCLVGLLLRLKHSVILSIIACPLWILLLVVKKSPLSVSNGSEDTAGVLLLFFTLSSYFIGLLIGLLFRWIRKSGKVFETLIVLAILVVLFFGLFISKDYHGYHLMQLTDGNREKSLVLNYVKNHPTVQAIGGDKLKLLPPSCLIKDNLQTRCEISVKGAKKFYAIVDILHSSGNPRLALACILYTPIGQDGSLMSACNQ